MIIYCTSVTQPWWRIRDYANRLMLEKGSGSARVLEVPPHLIPKEQLDWTEENMVLAPEFKGGGFLIVASTYELPILRMMKRIGQRRLNKPTEIYEDFAVHCVAQGRVAHLRVMNDGEFADVWLDGFFNERMNELF